MVLTFFKMHSTSNISCCYDYYLHHLLTPYAVLEDGLKVNFRDVSVGIMDCPDLTCKPWDLAAPGTVLPCDFDLLLTHDQLQWNLQ